MFELVVTQPFEHYAVGQRITDPDAVLRVLTEHPRSVVKVNPEAPAASSAPKKPPKSAVLSVPQ